MGGVRKVFVVGVWGISQKISGFIGTVKAKSEKEALKKAHLLPMYDYGQETKAWKYYKYTDEKFELKKKFDLKDKGWDGW
jgi:hypothetical protein